MLDSRPLLSLAAAWKDGGCLGAPALLMNLQLQCLIPAGRVVGLVVARPSLSYLLSERGTVVPVGLAWKIMVFEIGVSMRDRVLKLSV